MKYGSVVAMVISVSQAIKIREEVSELDSEPLQMMMNPMSMIGQVTEMVGSVVGSGQLDELMNSGQLNELMNSGSS